MKDYAPETGIPLDPTFGTHKLNCKLCQRFDPERPASASLLCLEGSVLWKRENQVKEKRAPIIRDEYRRSKEEVKAATRYK
jgi:hypothetical protein